MMADSSAEFGIRYAERLARHTSWRVGGPAEVFYTPKSIQALSVFLAEYHRESLVWLGLGSNVLVRDGGIKGTVIATVGGLSLLQETQDGIYAEAGVPLAKLARFCADRGYEGLEFLAGIPGTVGGALAMNAGAAGSDTWSHVGAVETIDRRGEIRMRRPAEFKVAYRSVEGYPGEWFVAARFELVKGLAVDGKRRIKECLAMRKRTQPIQTANAGSVFRNPPGDFAARLIEAAGLKGLREGGATVSARHANFIINDNNASAGDIERLIASVQSAVQERTGVLLELEVRILGDDQ
ncbi:MAG TPA: UDP-N-acetylmuramate dehydrogenase [Acidiferrobacter sp.]|nr:UDP-N-acetylmuramate dehydrogenase [Acidiferrobacter sp.]